MAELKIISRKEAKNLGLKKYFTGKPCKNGHVAERNCNSRVCVKCQYLSYKNYFAKNKEKENARSLSYRHRNLTKARESAVLWAKKNPEKKNAANATRRSKKINQTPAWLTDSQLDEIVSAYKLARDLSVSTGIPHHVDHIVPLNSPIVSGLHVPWNLQVITAAENCRKNNRLNDRT